MFELTFYRWNESVSYEFAFSFNKHFIILRFLKWAWSIQYRRRKIEDVMPIEYKEYWSDLIHEGAIYKSPFNWGGGNDEDN